MAAELVERVNSLRAEGKPVYLQVGCGENKLDGWINTDIEELDIRYKLPFEDSSLDAVFGEHVIQMLSVQDALKFLAECRRCLRPGGHLRLAFPDAVHMSKSRDCIPVAYEDRVFRRYGYDYVDNILIGHDHKSVWTEPLMRSVLENMNFSVCEDVCVGESEYEKFSGLEKHGQEIGTVPNFLETSVVHARRAYAFGRYECAVISAARPYNKMSLEERGFVCTTHFDPRDCEGYVDIPGEELYSHLGERKVMALSPFEHSLRKNWISILEDAPECTMLFLESDACPEIDGSVLSYLIDLIREEFQGVDIIRPFPLLRYAHMRNSAPTCGAVSDTVRRWASWWTPNPDKYANTPEIWGSHAYVVFNRQKLIDVFKKLALPTDMAVGYAAAHGMLNVVCTKQVLFYQQPHQMAHTYIRC